MYKILIQIVSDEEGAITRGYFRIFRENLKNATKIWLPALAALLVLGGNAFLIYKGVLKQMETLQTMAGALIVFLQYAFALIARFDAGQKQSLNIPGYFISLILHGIFTKTDSIHKEENYD